MRAARATFKVRAIHGGSDREKGNGSNRSNTNARVPRLVNRVLKAPARSTSVGVSAAVSDTSVRGRPQVHSPEPTHLTCMIRARVLGRSFNGGLSIVRYLPRRIWRMRPSFRQRSAERSKYYFESSVAAESNHESTMW